VALACAAVRLDSPWTRAAGTPAKCAAAKQKAAGKKAAAQLKCYSNAVAKAVAVDSACWRKQDEIREHLHQGWDRRWLRNRRRCNYPGVGHRRVRRCDRSDGEHLGLLQSVRQLWFDMRREAASASVDAPIPRQPSDASTQA